MANRDNPHGLSPLMRSFGGPSSVRQYSKDASEAVAIFINDAVELDDDGYIHANGTPGSMYILGVSLDYGAATTATNHLVVDDPHASFEAQDNADTDGFALADKGLSCNLELNAGSATTLISGHELDESSAHATNVLDVRLVGLLDCPDNAYGAHGRWEVTINKHFFGQGVGNPGI